MWWAIQWVLRNSINKGDVAHIYTLVTKSMVRNSVYQTRCCKVDIISIHQTSHVETLLCVRNERNQNQFIRYKSCLCKISGILKSAFSMEQMLKQNSTTTVDQIDTAYNLWNLLVSHSIPHLCIICPWYPFTTSLPCHSKKSRQPHHTGI